MLITLLASFALAAPAAPVEPELTWTLSVNGQPVGSRTVKVKILQGTQGTRRVLESFTEVSGSVGPVPIAFRQRMTAHAEGADPASFHSVVEQNGEASEIQGRFTATGWTVTTNVGGRVRTADYPHARIDLSTADLFDPESRLGLSRTDSARLLFAETGEVLQGAVERLGAEELTIAGKPVAVEGYAWAGPSGKASFWFSPEGYLVRYEVQQLGVPLQGVLTQPPPAGVDDFAVRVQPPQVERIPL